MDETYVYIIYQNAIALNIPFARARACTCTLIRSR